LQEAPHDVLSPQPEALGSQLKATFTKISSQPATAGK
jgi:hypothetical protein